MRLPLITQYAIREWADGLPPWTWWLTWPLWRLFGRHCTGAHERYWQKFYCSNCDLEIVGVYDDFDDVGGKWLKITASGTYGSMEGTVHWFRGIQTCPRCRLTWETEDSD